MKYLLDTCAISETIKPKPNRSFIDWLDSQDENNLFLSLLTIGELYKGSFKSKDKQKQKALLEWIEHHLKLRFHSRIIPLDDSVIYSWGKICGESEQNGRKLLVMDSLIAATAKAYDLIIVSQNIKDFEVCSVRTYNPWKN